MFAAAAVIAMAFVGCAKEETSMSINDLPGRAKVKGTVYYCEKQEHIEGTEMYKEVKVPAEYKLDETEYEFTMDYQDVTKEVVNKYANGKLKILK